MCNIPHEEQKKLFFLKFGQHFFNFEETQKLLKTLLELCFVQHTRTNSMFTFQPKKPATAKNANPALTCWIFLLGTKNQQIFCLGVMVHEAIQGSEWWLRKRKTISIFEQIYPPTTNKHTQTWVKTGKKRSIYGIILLATHCLRQLTKNSIPINFYTISLYSKATWFSQ